MFRDRKSSVRWVLPEGQYNPVVADGVRWLDYEHAAAPVALREGAETARRGGDRGHARRF